MTFIINDKGNASYNRGIKRFNDVFLEIASRATMEIASPRTTKAKVLCNCCVLNLTYGVNFCA